MAGVLLAELMLITLLEPGMTPPGFTGRGAYAMGIIFFGTFILAARIPRSEFFLIFGAAAAFLLYPFQFGDNNLPSALGDRPFSPEILASTGSWVIYVVSAALFTRMIAKVRWRLVVNVPLEHPMCSRCGYDLRAAEALCPECGNEFSRSDSKSFRSTRSHWDWRWLRRRAIISFLGIVLPAVGLYGYLYWRSERLAITRLQIAGAEVETHIDLPVVLQRWPAAVPAQPFLLLFAHADSVMWKHDPVTDDQLILLRQLPLVTEIHIDNSPLSESGFADAGPLEHLNGLYLPGSRINDAGLVAISKLTSLNQLQLDASQIDDAGLANLATLPHLSVLWIARTGVTDSGLIKLAHCPKLELLEVSGTKVTKNGIEKFRAQRPDIQIEWP